MKRLMRFTAKGKESKNKHKTITYHNHVEPRKVEPWDCIQLSKAERKCKTPQEIQELRKAKYEGRK